MQNRICQILGCEKPIVQGPLSWLTDAKLVAAVSEAGGLGVLGPHAGQTSSPQNPEEATERMRQQIQEVRRLTDKPFGINLIFPDSPRWTEPLVELVKRERVPVVVYTGYGDTAIDERVIQELKACGTKIIYRDLNPTPENARRAEEAGVDIIVATGFDEGGTLPGRAIGTLTIVPIIVDAVKSVPVMAAGGIADVRTAKAAFALGAEGVFAGTYFLATEESPMHPEVKQRVLDATAYDLLLFRTIPDYYRSLSGELANELSQMDKLGKSNEEIGERMGGAKGLRYGMIENDQKRGYISLGLGVTQIKSIRSVKEAIDALSPAWS